MSSSTTINITGLAAPFSPLAFFDNELRAKDLRSDIDYEGVSNYVFIYAAELDAVVSDVLPFSHRSVRYLSALILYELLNSTHSVDHFVERTQMGLIRILNNDVNRSQIFQFRINRLSETWHVSKFLTELEPNLRWLHHYLVDHNLDTLTHCEALIGLGMDFMWRGVLHGQYVFQPFIMD